jgi:hypothetical protein
VFPNSHKFPVAMVATRFTDVELIQCRNKTLLPRSIDELCQIPPKAVRAPRSLPKPRLCRLPFERDRRKGSL